ncbi:hypothetical protein ACFQT0_16930 [Hymenobacter humi]|uniref:Uncharacterized protein n=1 Tax=Hymenobacter humi TaxID=1411620 RepID=A0ABW2U708_9BACT
MQTVAVAPDSAKALRHLWELLKLAQARHPTVAIAGAQHNWDKLLAQFPAVSSEQ